MWRMTTHGAVRYLSHTLRVMGTWAWSLGETDARPGPGRGDTGPVYCDLCKQFGSSALCSNNPLSHCETVYHGNNVKYYAGGFKFLTLFITWWQHHVLYRKIYIYISSIIHFFCVCDAPALCSLQTSQNVYALFILCWISWMRFKYLAAAWPLHLLLAPLASEESRQVQGRGIMLS